MMGICPELAGVGTGDTKLYDATDETTPCRLLGEGEISRSKTNDEQVRMLEEAVGKRASGRGKREVWRDVLQTVEIYPWV